MDYNNEVFFQVGYRATYDAILNTGTFGLTCVLKKMRLHSYINLCCHPSIEVRFINQKLCIRHLLGLAECAIQHVYEHDQ